MFHKNHGWEVLIALFNNCLCFSIAANGGNRLVNNKVRTSGLSLCNNRPVLVRMANQQQNCSQGRTTQNNVIHNSNSGIKSTPRSYFRLPFGLEKTLDVEMLMLVLQDFASAEISRNSMSNYSFL
jgi:hypothetical protein